MVRVFLASPGGVGPERETAIDVVQRLNGSVAQHMGCQVRLDVWEDMSPGYGRPQALINSRADKCDLFVGLVFRRWGSATGAYSSGFEEEFEKAIHRRRAGESPEIMLFFKSVDQESLQDAGPQLSRVLKFRADIESRREVLYSEVANRDNWKDSFTDALLSFLSNWRVLKSSEPPRRNMEATEGLVGATEDHAEDEVSEEAKTSLAKGIANLPDSQKTVVTLRYFEGMSLEEISKVLGLSANEVANEQGRALTSLRHGFNYETKVMDALRRVTPDDAELRSSAGRDEGFDAAVWRKTGHEMPIEIYRSGDHSKSSIRRRLAQLASKHEGPSILITNATSLTEAADREASNVSLVVWQSSEDDSRLADVIRQGLSAP